MRQTLIPIFAVLAWGGVCTSSTAQPLVSAGQRIAQRDCGGCHAVGSGASPLADAPPFRDLHRRYPAGGLRQILQEGMIAPLDPPEEGSPRRHPRMPMVTLGEDELADLTAYLKSLESSDLGPRRR